MKDEFPEDYPSHLIKYSWSINNHFGIMNYWTKYCDEECDKNSKYFVSNYLKNYFTSKMNRDALTKDISNYISFLTKCFSVSWNDTEGCFKMTMKREKDNHKKFKFNKDEFYRLNIEIGIQKNKAKQFLKIVLDDMTNFYNTYEEK